MSRERKGTHAYKPRKEKDNSFFSFIPQEKRKTVGIIALAVAAVVLAVLLLQWFGVIHIGGRIHKSFFGDKLYKSDKDIVVNGGSSSSPAYYVVGTYEGTDKYTLEPNYQGGTDKLKSEWKYDSVKADPLYMMQVYGSPFSAEALLNDVTAQLTLTDQNGEQSLHATVGKNTSATGLEYAWLISDTMPVPYLYLYYMSYGQIDTPDYYMIDAYAFVETADDSCVVVHVLGRAETEKEMPENEIILARLSEFADLVYAQENGNAKEVLAFSGDEQSEEIVAGYYAGTDKYALDTEYTSEDKNLNAGWKYDGVKADPIYFMYVCGVNKNASEMFETLKENYAPTDEEGNKTGEEFAGTIEEGVSEKGLKYHWLATDPQPQIDYTLYQDYGLEYPESYVKYSYAYVETTDDRCAMVAVYGKAETQSALPEDAALFERCLEFINLIDKP